jgi:hypothetical protein
MNDDLLDLIDAECDPDPLDTDLTKYYCPWCLEEFDYEEELDAHEQECEAYLPWKGGQ